MSEQDEATDFPERYAKLWEEAARSSLRPSLGKT